MGQQTSPKFTLRKLGWRGGPVDGWRVVLDDTGVSVGHAARNGNGWRPVLYRGNESVTGAARKTRKAAVEAVLAGYRTLQGTEGAAA